MASQHRHSSDTPGPQPGSTSDSQNFNAQGRFGDHGYPFGDRAYPYHDPAEPPQEQPYHGQGAPGPDQLSASPEPEPQQRFGDFGYTGPGGPAEHTGQHSDGYGYGYGLGFDAPLIKGEPGPKRKDA